MFYLAFLLSSGYERKEICTDKTLFKHLSALMEVKADLIKEMADKMFEYDHRK